MVHLNDIFSIVAAVTVLFVVLFLVIQKTVGEKGKLLKTRKALFVICLSCFVLFIVSAVGQII